MDARKSSGSSVRGKRGVVPTDWGILVDQVKRRKAAFAKRLIANLKPTPDGQHLLWIGRIKANGYGDISFNICGPRRHDETQRVKRVYVHRLFLMLMLKRPIADGMEAGHKLGCLHRSCVVHVEEQTRAYNMQLVWEQKRGQSQIAENDCPF